MNQNEKQDLSLRLITGASLLIENRSLWSFHPFTQEVHSWECDYPEASDFLRSWTPEEVEHFEMCPQNHPEAPSSILDIFSRCQEYTNLPIMYDSSFSCSKQLLLNIKERKRHQLIPFISCIQDPCLNYVDWCCGKGHLGRMLASIFGANIVGIENNLQVIEKGRSLAPQKQVFIECDVFHNDIPDFQGGMVALHSCGSLLTKAMEQVFEQDLQECFLVSCCYHKINEEFYVPMSETGKKQHVCFTKKELRLPSTLEHHASKKSKRRRRADMRYRLSIDYILQEIGFHSSYTSFPPVPDFWKDLSFQEYVDQVWARENYPSISKINVKNMEEKGREQLRIIRALSSFRSMFGRVLEVWINTDRALWLQEKGYNVTLGICMPKSASPRNIAIQAKL